MVKPIRGAQEPPLTPNDVRPECICVPKVYDFVLLTEEFSTTVPITPDAATCPAVVTDITCSVETDAPFFPISCDFPQGDCVILSRIPIDGTNAVVVKLQQSVPVTITLSGGGVSCDIAVTVPVIKQVVLCLPPELDESNLVCRILAATCTILTPIPPGGIPLADLTSVTLELEICKEVQVLAAVKLEVLAKFCQPRPPLPVPPTIVCPPSSTLFPQQCDFFPVANCECEGRVVDNDPLRPCIVTVDGTCTLTVNGTARDTGLQTLVATTCNVCAPVNTSIDYRYFLTTEDPTPNIILTARSADTESCTTDPVTGNLTQVISGPASVEAESGTFTGTYTLTLTETAGVGTPDSWTLVFNSVGFNFTAANIAVPDDLLQLFRCTQFPPPVTP